MLLSFYYYVLRFVFVSSFRHAEELPDNAKFNVRTRTRTKNKVKGVANKRYKEHFNGNKYTLRACIVPKWKARKEDGAWSLARQRKTIVRPSVSLDLKKIGMRVKVEIPRIDDRNAKENAILRQGVSLLGIDSGAI